MARCTNRNCNRDSACAPGCHWFPYAEEKKEKMQEEILRNLEEINRKLKAQDAIEPMQEDEK